MSPTPDIENVVVWEFYTNLGIDFDSNKNECDYNGISCDENGRVTSIVLGTFHLIKHTIAYNNSQISLPTKMPFFCYNQDLSNA